MYPASTAPLSVSSGSSMGSPHSICTSKASSCPTFGVSAAEANVRGGSSATSVRRQPAISSSGRLGTLTLITTGSRGRAARIASATRAPTSAALSQRWSASISSQPWPSTP